MSEIEHVQVAIADFEPHPRNYNEHPEPQVSEIAESLRLFGQVKPVVVWRRWFVAGHGVVLGARRLGWTHVKAERLPDDWPEHKALAYLAADNELARGASPNLQALAALAADIRAEDETLARLAAGGAEGLQRLMESLQVPDSDEWGNAFDRLPDRDRSPFQQMTFTLHDDQAGAVKDALAFAKSMGDFVDTGNANSNGNALARICETFLTDYGQS